METDFKKSFITFSQELYKGEEKINLHRPIFEGNESKYVLEAIESNYVSSVGKRVDEFEEKIAKYTGLKYAIAVVNGTAALHVSLQLLDVKQNDEVITQALTFIATCNAVSYCGAKPVFIDVDRETMGMSPKALMSFLKKNAKEISGKIVNKNSGREIKACLPMHTFGFPCQIKEIQEICKEWNIPLIEDCAESLGSYVDNKHTGKFGRLATLSFNGNKIITTGGGGMIITDNNDLARKAKHITTTSKVPHYYEFIHDEIGYNYRLPNLNAAMGCAQIEMLDNFLLAKQEIAEKWEGFFKDRSVNFFRPLKGFKANNWLNAIILKSKSEKEEFLNFTNDNNIMTRPIWRLMNELDMYADSQHDGLKESYWLQDRVVNIPSSVPNGILFKKNKK